MNTPSRFDPFGDLLASQSFVVLDGGLATELERRGADLNDALWSARVLLDDPTALLAVHASYLEAGADVIATASYQATIPGLVRRGMTGTEAAAVIATSVLLAREARDRFVAEQSRPTMVPPLIAGSVGPYGAYLSDGSEYTGCYDLTTRELKAFHRDRLEILIDAGVDLIGCETIPSVREADALVDLLEVRATTPAWVSFATASDRAIADGTPFAAAVSSIQQAKVVAAVGVNCLPAERVASLLERAETSKPLIVYPNAGGAYDATLKVWRGDPITDPIVHLAERWHRLGARIIGGCCRTGPPTVAALRRLLGPKHHEPAT